MAFFLLFVHVFAINCKKPCLDSCENTLTMNCLKKCCPGINFSINSSCSLKCSDSSEISICHQQCLKQLSTCEKNCQEFCDNRADDCEQACLYEFCGEEFHSVSWTYVIGLVFLFCSFVAGLFAYVDEVISKTHSYDLA
jgi:hypothetical protein